MRPETGVLRWCNAGWLGRIAMAPLVLVLMLLPNRSLGYPLDGADYTGIERLEGYRLAQEGKANARRLHPGALLDMEAVDLRLLDRPELMIPAVDPELKRELVALLGRDRNRYSVALLDLTNPDAPVYAEHRGDKRFNPGSVGKLVVAIGIFQALAEAFPDVEVRESILRDTMVRADGFIRKDRHKVPIWNAATKRMQHRPVRLGDEASLWTWLDWMMSASSNAAASMVMKQFMLLDHFGAEYPVEPAREKAFFAQTKPAALASALREGLDTALAQQGVDTEVFRQGGFFTREGKRRVPAGGSRATTQALMQLLLRLEKGDVVDVFSSREIKRLLYMTQKRIRYASSPALRDSAVYFKSGSLYQCRPEPDFVCLKYQGNVKNLLNSVASVESPDGLRYLVVVNSNVLRVNSAVAHQSLATWIHRLLQKRNAALLKPVE